MAVTIIAIPGSGGSAAFQYDSEDDVLASHVINHNLGFYPNVSCFIKGTNQPIVGVVIHHSLVQCEVVFNSPHAILARLS